MSPRTTQQLRGGAICAATVLLGISWSFALLHIHTDAYPVLWALAMPFLAFYYVSGQRRVGSWRFLPAAALSIYAVVLWQISHSYGLLGSASTVLGVVAAGAALGLGSRLSPRRAAAIVSTTQPRVVAPRTPEGRRRPMRAQGARR